MADISDYEISEMEDIYKWHPDVSIKPELNEKMIKDFGMLHSFPDEKSVLDFLNAERNIRENVLVSRIYDARYTVWNRIFEVSGDNKKILPYLSLACLIKINPATKKFFDAVTSNLDYFEMMWNITSKDDAVDRNSKIIKFPN